MDAPDTANPVQRSDDADRAPPSEIRSYGFFIDGDWQEAPEHLERCAPGTGRPVARFGIASRETVDGAVTAASRSMLDGRWSDLPAAERARVLERVAALVDERRQHLARLDAEEAGKPLRVARADLEGAAELFRFAASLARTSSGRAYTNHGPDFTGLVVREPVGVVALVTPWNFPALILAQKLPFALAAGCTVVVKPSELTSSSTMEIASLCDEAGLPAGVLNVVTGGAETGAALVAHPLVEMVSFTGSTATGRKVIEASTATIKKLSLELGGKAATLVFADADLDAAAEAVTFGVLFNNGECCVSQARLLVEESIAEDFVADVARRFARVRVGSPLEESTDVGAMITPEHRARVLETVATATEEGATLVVGSTEEPEGDGWFLQPTILSGVAPSMQAFQREIFGPVLTVTTFRTAEEAVDLANDVEYGLSNTVWSSRTDTCIDVARSLRSGTVYVNTTIDGPPTMPIGGVKASGFGRELGEAGLEEFTELKSINIRTGERRGAFDFGAGT